ncbi:MAG: DNA polymerase III subunit epsilon [Methylococcales bacterium]|nr:DNA polymerase III subunit epsilon [Methylococcales bacterium]
MTERVRQIVLDTETTGLEPKQGHRIIEIGAVELVGRRLTGRTFHVYLNPEREVEAGAVEVHGLSNDFLVDKPRFAQEALALLNFISDAELIIHNAPFDVGFLDHELSLMGSDYRVSRDNAIFDTLVFARQKHPGQRNSLDALCKRYGVDNSHRELHGALLDAEILADVYLLMTGGQRSLLAESDGAENSDIQSRQPIALPPGEPLPVLHGSAEELTAHAKQLELIAKTAGHCLWQT